MDNYKLVISIIMARTGNGKLELQFHFWKDLKLKNVFYEYIVYYEDLKGILFDRYF